MVSAVATHSLSEKSPETLEELIEILRPYHSEENLEVVRRAFEYATKAHEGQYRRSGDPYILHPIGVAGILGELKLDISSVATGLLHDTVEDTNVTLEDLEQHFGVVIKGLVDGVTKLTQMRFRHTHEKQGENIRKMIVATGKDVRVTLVKLADRLHNMRTLNHMPYEKQARIAQETLDIYAPLAGRLGISSLKIQLEDLGFRYSRPDMYYQLVQKIDKKKKEREKYIDEVKDVITSEIKSRSKMSFQVSGRPKHLYSIFKKMSMRNVDFEQVYDLLAFRVCVNSIAECYEALGVIHSLWKPIPGRFKDFIAMPKANNYQSLHTTVIGPMGERIEVQIRTYEMHLVAEWGIAAHWKYKEQSRGSGSVEDELTTKFRGLRELVSLHQQTNNSDEFLENVKVDLAEETEIYVFTPKGDVKEFPENATPIDFAYSVHTDVGNTIVAARVNGKLVSLKYQLQNGDTVEVITSKNQSPNKDWLKICVTSRAKSKIRAHVKLEQRKRALSLGKEILERSFRKLGVNIFKHMNGANFEALLKEHGCNNGDDLFILVGYGKVTPNQVGQFLLPEAPEKEEASEESYLQKVLKSAIQKRKKTRSIISVDGMDDVLVRYAKCCSPIPGDSIVGFISRGRGITVHRADCEKAFELDSNRQVEVEWTDNSAREADRMVRVRVVSHDQSGLLKGMTEVFSAHGVNIHNAQIKTTRDKKAICIFDVSVRDTKQLSEVIHALQKLKGILGVTRMTHS